MKLHTAGARAALKGLRQFMRWTEEHALFSHAAATGFFLFLSIPPAVLVLVSLVGLIPLERMMQILADEGRAWLLLGVKANLDPEAGSVAARLLDNALAPWFAMLAESQDVPLAIQVQRVLDRNLPVGAAVALGQLVWDVLEGPRPGLLTIGFVMILWSASGATRMIMRALNEIYEVRRQAFLQRILVSLVLTLSILVGASFILTALPLGNAVAQAVVEFFDLPSAVLGTWAALNWFVGVVFMLGVACVVLRHGPNARQNLRLVTPGASLTVLLWVALGLGLRTWTPLVWERTNATYGTLAVVILLLLWCFLVCFALLLGAEVNAWVVERRGLAQRVVAGRVLGHARRWPPLEPYVRSARRRWLRRIWRRAPPAQHLAPEEPEPKSPPS